MRAFFVVFGLLLILAGAWLGMFAWATATMIDPRLNSAAWWSEVLGLVFPGVLLPIPFIALGVCSIATGGRAHHGRSMRAGLGERAPDFDLKPAHDFEPDIIANIRL